MFLLAPGFHRRKSLYCLGEILKNNPKPVKSKYKKARHYMINTALETKLVQQLELQEVDAADFYRTIFPKGSLEEAGNQQPGKYNAMVTAVRPNLDKADLLVMHDDLALLSEMRASDAYMNCISYAGKEDKEDYARYLYAFFVRVNLSTHPDVADAQISALKQYLKNGYLSKRNRKKVGNKFEWVYSKNEIMHFIRPTYLMVDHEHLYMCFVLYRPLSMFPEHRRKLQELVNDISEKINYGLRLPAIYPVEILECRTVVGKGDCRAYRFPEKRLRHVSLDELNACVPKKKQLYIKGESSFDDQPNLFPWFLREVRKPENWKTMKPRVFVTAAAYAAKGSISLATMMEELEKLGEELLPLFGEKEIRKQINDARYFYMYDFYWQRRRTREYLSDECGIEIKKRKRNKGAEHHTRSEHCKNVNRDVNALLKREEEVTQWFAKNPKGTQKACAEYLGISISTVNKWVKRARNTATGEQPQEAEIVPEQPFSQRKAYSEDEKICPLCGQPLCKTETSQPTRDGTPDYWVKIVWDCDNEDCANHNREVHKKWRRVKVPMYLSNPYSPSEIHIYGKEQENLPKDLSGFADEDSYCDDEDLPF